MYTNTSLFILTVGGFTLTGHPYGTLYGLLAFTSTITIVKIASKV